MLLQGAGGVRMLLQGVGGVRMLLQGACGVRMLVQGAGGVRILLQGAVGGWVSMDKKLTVQPIRLLLEMQSCAGFLHLFHPPWSSGYHQARQLCCCLLDHP